MRRLVLLVVIGLFALATAIVWVVQTRIVFNRVAANARDGMESIIGILEYQMEPELCRFARDLVDEWGDIGTAMKADCAAVAHRLRVDRVSIVGANGIVLASSEPKFVGFDFAANPNTAEFLALNTGTGFINQPCRRPVDMPDAPLMKFVGIPFSGGGFVQIGDSFHPGDLARRNYIVTRSMEDEHISDDGFYTLVDENQDLVLSSYSREDSGGKASDAGFTALDFGAGDGPAIGTVFGKESIVWRGRPTFLDAVAYVTFPLDSILHARNVSVGLAALLLFILLSVGYGFFLKINAQGMRLSEQNKKMEAFYAKEEADRQRDLALAKNIQTSALPSVIPPYSGRKEFDLYAMMRTAKEVGGDFYDFYFVGPNKICLVMADVSGKGVPAALFMMRSKATIKSCVTTESDLAIAMARANDGLCANNAAEMFVTAWVGVVDLETGELRYVSAGHNPPFVRHADGTVEMIKVKRALVLAAVEGAKYCESSIGLRPGDRIFLYTDGVTEATATDGSLLGEVRLGSALKDGQGNAEACCNWVIEAVDAFVGEAPQADDITVLTFDYKGC